MAKPNYELLTFLEEMMKDLKYDVKGFFRVVYNSSSYQREAETSLQTSLRSTKAPITSLARFCVVCLLNRSWDSLVALTTANPESVIRRGAETYKQVMNVDPATLKSAEDILGWKDQWSKVSKLEKYSGEAVSRDDMVSRMRRCSGPRN